MRALCKYSLTYSDVLFFLCFSISGRHFCFDCNERSKFHCISCPNGVCRKCFAASDFTVVRGVKGLCIDCSELALIVERNLDLDSEGVGV